MTGSSVLSDGVYAPHGLINPFAWAEIEPPDILVNIDGTCNSCIHSEQKVYKYCPDKPPLVCNRHETITKADSVCNKYEAAILAC